MKTIADFRIDCEQYPEEVITASGYINSRGCYDCNTSAILTRLIQEAGRWCEYYASDLFISWEAVKDIFTRPAVDFSASFLFGFRRSGVDHSSFVLSRANNEPCYGSIRGEYRALWRVDMNGDGTRVEMVLGRVF